VEISWLEDDLCIRGFLICPEFKGALCVGARAVLVCAGGLLVCVDGGGL